MARLGGDEFAFLLFGDIAMAGDKPCASPSASWTSCEIRCPSGGVIQVGCTIGVAVYPEDAANSTG